jgi:photosystem II stability/assembly factor-like uncharacterized protein
MPKGKAARVAWLLLVCALLPGCLAAGQNSWTTNGPYGGFIRRIVIDGSNPNTLYSCAYGAGVFKSVNGAATWRSASSGLASGRVTDLVIDPIEPQIVYTATDEGIFKSTDGAAHWTRLPTNQGWASAIALAPGNRQILLAATVSPGASRLTTLYRTVDGGGTWTPLTTNLPDSLIGPIAISPSDPAIVIAAEADRLFRSTDGGSNWDPVGAQEISASVIAVAFDPRDSSIAYLGTAGGGAFKSSDGGATWSPSNDGLASPYVSSLQVSQGAVYAGSDEHVFRSTDHGQTWVALPSTALFSRISVTAIALDGVSPATIYLGTTRGALKTVDGGSTWATANEGINAIVMQAVAIPGSSQSVAYAGGDRGVYRTTNGGVSWSSRSEGLHYFSTVAALGIDPSNSDVLYAGSFGCCGIYKTTDGGALWSLIFQRGAIVSIVVDPTRPARVFAVDAFDGPFRSVDAGATWTATNAGLPRPAAFFADLAIDPEHTNTLFLVASSPSEFQTGLGVYKSVDGGDSWKLVNNGLPSRDIRHLIMDPLDHRTLYAATPTSLFVTRNGGNLWLPLPGTLPLPTFSLAIDPTRTSVLYAATGKLGVFRSTDGGTSWAPFGNGFGDAEAYRVIPASGGRILYAATNRGVFQYEAVTTSFFTLAPCRLIDTRDPGDSAIAAGSERVISLTGRCGIPASARSLALNLTVTESTDPGGLALSGDSPSGETFSISYRALQTRANNAIIGLDSLGRLRIRSIQPFGTVHLILDVTGYFQ